MPRPNVASLPLPLPFFSPQLIAASAVGLWLVAAAEWAERSLLAGAVALTLSTALAVLLATLCSRPLRHLVAPAELLGKLLLLLFFGSIGCTAGNLASAVRAAGTGALLCFGGALYLVHLLTVFLGGCWAMKVSMPDALLASNANIGNAATASALAASLGWENKLLPAMLVGTLGNVVGSFLGLWVGGVLQSVPH
jgi:uncharacterized membrane protein